MLRFTKKSKLKKFEDMNHNNHTVSNLNLENHAEEIKSLEKKLPFVGSLSKKAQRNLFVITALISFFGAGYQYQSLNNSYENDSKALKFSLDIKKDGERINDSFNGVMNGDRAGLNALNESIIKSYNQLTTFVTPYYAPAEYDELIKVYNELSSIVNYLNKNNNFMINVDSLSNYFVNETNKIIDMISKFEKDYTKLGINNVNILILKNELSNIQVITNKILLSSNLSDANNNIELLKGSYLKINKLIEDIESGEASKRIPSLKNIGAKEIIDTFAQIKSSWINVGNTINGLYGIYAGSVNRVSIINGFKGNLKKLEDLSNSVLELTLSNSQGDILLKKVIMFILLILGLLFTYMMFLSRVYELYNETIKLKYVGAEVNKQMINLAGEMTAIQEGDLTQKTTVSNELIGSIADAYNASLDSLVLLIQKIKDAHRLMENKTNEIKTLSGEMLDATLNQKESLDKTNMNVSEIIKDINDVVKKAEDSSKLAEKALEISNKSAEDIKDSIESMNQIDSNMSKTVLLMKKVDQSSKKISTIVEVLREITQNTSILAMNATLHATKSGKENEGFKALADSMKDLAEKATRETQQVSEIIQTVQNDINEVDESIKRTQEEVKEGVNKSEKTSESLERISNASDQIQKTVAILYNESKRYSETAKNVGQEMLVFTKVTEDNIKSVSKAVQEIEQIGDASKELSDSVARFKIKRDSET